TGRSTHIEVSMAHNLQMLAYGYFASYQGGAGWPRPGQELLTGGSPRYQVYPTADGRYVACAALEQKFWNRLLELIGLDASVRDDAGEPRAVIAALTARFRQHTAEFWSRVLDGEDVCTVVIATWDEAVAAQFVDI